MDMVPWGHIYGTRYPILGEIPDIKNGERTVSSDGFTRVFYGYTSWIERRPFSDVDAFTEYMEKRIDVREEVNKMKTKFTLTLIFILTVLTTLARQTNTAKSQVVTKGLVSYWTFDEADIIKDETVKDAWGNNDGTIIDKPKIAEGKVAECLKFDGIDDCVGVGDNPSLNFGKGDFSVEAWVQFNTWAVQKEYQTIEKTSGFESSSGWALEISTWGQASQKFGFIFAITTGPNWADNAFGHSEFSYDTGQWYHVVVTRSGSTCKLYMDSTFVVKETNGAFSKSVDNNVDLDIGKAIWDQYFNGLIDEVRIYSQALSESEVERNFAAEGLAVVSPIKKLALTWGEVKVSR